jgi:cytochrome c-type biogenesis protein CcmH
MPTGPTRSLVASLLPLIVLGLVVLVEAQQPARHLDEPEVYEIASQLRCVVCQNLSVADSPSETATQMRGVIRQRLAAGERPDQVIQYFVDKYGEWILLEPRRHGFTLIVWLLPPLAAVAGIGLAAVLLTRWTRRRRRATAATPTTNVDPAMSERIRRELADL